MFTAMFKFALRMPRTIGVRIFAGFGVILLIVVAEAVVGKLGFDNAVFYFNRHREANQVVREILELERNVLELQRGVLAYTYSGYAGVAERVKEQRQLLVIQMTKAREMIHDPARLAILDRMDAHLEIYSDSFTSAIEERSLRDEMAFSRMAGFGDSSVEMLSRLGEERRARSDSEGSLLSGLLQEKLLYAQRDALRFLIKPNSRLVRENLDRLPRIERLLTQLATHLGQGGSETETVQALQTGITRFDQAFNGMVRATRAYMHLVYVVMGGEAAEIAHLARELKDLTLRDQAQAEADMITAIAQSETIARWVSFGALLLGLFLAWRISRDISTPIRAMTLTLQHLARGRMDAEIPGTGRSDEIGTMALAAHVFKEKAHELANASRYKSEFLANMSHELRTPLNSLLILARMLARNEERNLTRAQVESAQVIHESGSDLLRLINDILDLSKVEAGRMDVLWETRGFESFLRGVERLFRPVAEQKGIDFRCAVDPGLPLEWRTDWAKVEQVVRNFLSNAFKFTAQGHVRVRVTRLPAGTVLLNPALAADTCVAIVVNDSGIGIPEDKREQIFEAFRQVDGTTSRQYGGTGLGLSISRKFAELIGGEIRVESHLGQGSTFSLLIPAIPPESLDPRRPRHVLAPEEENDITAPEPTFRDPTRILLIVDDDTRNLFALRQLLESRVGAIHTARNGRDAIEMLEAHPDVDLVLMDIMMPEMDGLEAMRQIRSQSRFSRLPMLALTAKVMPGDRDQCMEAGASDYLPKPVEPLKLFSALADWLGTPKPVVFTRGPGGEREVVGEAGSTEPVREDPSVTVLIVDADMRSTFGLAQALEKRVGRILVARDEGKAREMLEREPAINLVLMESRIFLAGGQEALRVLRQGEPTRVLSVIVLIDAAQPDDTVSRALQAGADDCLQKPVPLDALLRILIQGHPAVKRMDLDPCNVSESVS
ncbi:MAG: response regulator [Magnetococcales bacterium]|nr:response regulator [Magnetococcales bacterium]